jgi:GMP synthase (glutamine-hydrolysing)
MGLHPDQVQCVSIFDRALSSLNLAEVDALLVGGAGQYSVLDELPAVQRFVSFLAFVATDASTADLPMFASCFGFQGLVLGLGGSVIEDAMHAEVGSYPLHRKPDAEGDAVFGHLPADFMAQLGHKDRATALPPGLLDIAGSARCPYQAIRVCGRPQVATQFHPELAASDNRSRFLRYMREYGEMLGQEAAQERLDSHVPSPEANSLLEHFTAGEVMKRYRARGRAI